MRHALRYDFGWCVDSVSEATGSIELCSAVCVGIRHICQVQCLQCNHETTTNTERNNKTSTAVFCIAYHTDASSDCPESTPKVAGLCRSSRWNIVLLVARVDQLMIAFLFPDNHSGMRSEVELLTRSMTYPHLCLSTPPHDGVIRRSTSPQVKGMTMAETGIQGPKASSGSKQTCRPYEKVLTSIGEINVTVRSIVPAVMLRIVLVGVI